jgi:aspartate aminotransferase-like enzyme
MTAAVHNLFAPGETVLVVEGGKFAQRWTAIAAGRGLTVGLVKVPWGEAVTVARVEEALREHPEARGLLVQISETSTGVQHPIELLGRLTRAQNIFLVADGVSSVGIAPARMDEWDIDCLVCGSQKGLMTPPGLAMIALSERAWARAAETDANCLYFDLPAELAMLRDKGETRFTPAISLIYGLRESLRIVEEGGGFSEVFRKQWALTMMARAGIKAMGLSPFAASQFAWGVTSVALPAGVDGLELLRLMQEDWGVIIEGGPDHLRGRIVRIGHMGWTDWSDLAAGLHALARSLPGAGGFTASRDHLEAALAAYSRALDAGPGRSID